MKSDIIKIWPELTQKKAADWLIVINNQFGMGWDVHLTNTDKGFSLQTSYPIVGPVLEIFNQVVEQVQALTGKKEVHQIVAKNFWIWCHPPVLRCSLGYELSVFDGLLDYCIRDVDRLIREER